MSLPGGMSVRPAGAWQVCPTAPGEGHCAFGLLRRSLAPPSCTSRAAVAPQPGPAGHLRVRRCASRAYTRKSFPVVPPTAAGDSSVGHSAPSATGECGETSPPAARARPERPRIKRPSRIACSILKGHPLHPNKCVRGARCFSGTVQHRAGRLRLLPLRRAPPHSPGL